MSDEVRSGQLRPDAFPEVMGLTESVAYSGRVALSAMSYYKAMEDYPKPIAELACGPVYLAAEIRAFWDAHPVQKRLTKAERERVRLLALTPEDDESVAALFGVGVEAIAIIRRREAKRKAAERRQS